MPYESYVSAVCHLILHWHTPYLSIFKARKGTIVSIHDSLSESVQRLIQSRDLRHIICCEHLQIPPSSAAPSAASSAIIIASRCTDILCPFAAFLLIKVHDSNARPMLQTESYVIKKNVKKLILPQIFVFFFNILPKFGITKPQHITYIH